MQSEADRLLEKALAAYANVEPRIGLEHRVLAGVRARRRKAPLLWTAFAACVALTMVFLATLPRGVEELSFPKPAPPIHAVLPPASKPAVVQHLSSVRPHHPPPRLDSFPRRSPMTAEEKLLLQLAQSPEQAKVLLSDRHDRPVSPIEMDHLQLPALNQNEE